MIEKVLVDGAKINANLQQIVDISNTLDAVKELAVMNKRIQYLVRSAKHVLSKGPVTTEIYLAANGNYRVLINGQVHPLWCGFVDADVAKEAIDFCFS